MVEEAPLVHVEGRAEGVAVVRVDNPKVNALSTALLTQLEAAAGALADDPPGSVVVTGGDRLFAAGADIGELGGAPEAPPAARVSTGACTSISARPSRSPGSLHPPPIGFSQSSVPSTSSDRPFTAERPRCCAPAAAWCSPTPWPSSSRGSRS